MCSNKKKTTEEFVKEASAVHGNRYDFSRVEYISAHSKVTVICTEHGPWEISPHSILKGCGCKKCAGTSKYTTEDFVKKVNALHGEKLDLSKVEYTASNIKVTAICKKHGSFQIRPDHLLRGVGCPDCKKDTLSGLYAKPFSVFEEEIFALYGNDYSVSNVGYKNALTKINITCKKHGEFQARPADLLNGHGCPSCAKYGFDPQQIALFYLLVCESSYGSFVGYGITKEIEQRLRQHTLSLSKSAFVITRQHVWNFQTGASALALENAVKKQFSQASTLGCSIAGFKRESTDAPFDQVKEFIENILQENPEWQLT